MANNVTLPGAGAVVETVEVSGAQRQIVQVANLPATQPVSAAANLPTSKNATIFQFSSQNTSSAQLAAGATFAGVVETALDQPSISLLLTSDQPTTLTVKQFIDAGGSRAVPDIVFYVDANVGFSRSFTINGNYVQVLAQNTGPATTTTFSLNTAYGDLGDSESGGIMPVTELPLVLAGASAQTATVNNILTPVSGSAPINVGGYRSASVQVVSTATGGGYIFEQSNDGSNWVALPVFNAALVTSVPITAAVTPTASAIIYTIPLRCLFFRLRISTALTGGSVRAFSRISTDSWTGASQLVASNTAANLNANVSGTVTATVTGGTVVGVAPATTNAILSSAATTNGTVAKASAGTIYGLTASNTGAAVAFVKLHNSTTITVGTTAVALTVPIPAGGVVSVAWGAQGMRYSAGICYSITNLSADNDTTAVAAGQVKVNLSYI